MLERACRGGWSKRRFLWGVLNGFIRAPTGGLRRASGFEWVVLREVVWPRGILRPRSAPEQSTCRTRDSYHIPRLHVGSTCEVGWSKRVSERGLLRQLACL